jgi:hypothetical protein
MNDTTSILDLTTDPVNGGSVSNNNITLQSSEINTQTNNQNSNASSFSLDQTTINQIVSGLQQASATGATQLPSRDIPMTTNNLTQDPNIQPNYIPQPQITQDYIKNEETTDDIINKYNRSLNNSNSLDDMYNEIQEPLLIAILYFLFQLPFFRKNLFNYLPMLFNKDGNYNIQGFMFTSILFGMIFYLLNKITTHFGTF